MLVAARVVCKAPLHITQGGYNAGGVAASAGTHDRDALDIRARDLSAAERKEAVSILRKVGFAAWVRNPSQSDWPWHIHCIPIGGDLSSGAANQVDAYLNNRNGLASNGKDDGPRTWVDWTWEKYKKTYPDLLTEDTLSAADVTEIKNFTEARLKAYIGWDAKNLTQQMATALANIEALNQKYAVAVNNHIDQLDAANDAVDAGIKADVAKLNANLSTLTTKLDALTTKVDALPKA
jgi:hypothetical protein